MRSLWRNELDLNVALACKGAEPNLQGFLKKFCSFPTDLASLIVHILTNLANFFRRQN